MTKHRRYQLLCPIARALDVLGDRWTLLILRDLHAGPARFQELQEGLGIATNLLTTRLAEMTASGMIERSKQAGYQLTNAGRSTDRILWELTRFGTGVERDEDPRQPGNLRTIALPLRILLESVVDRPEMRARLIVDDAVLTITSTVDAVDIDWGETVEPVDVVARTSYNAFLDVAEGNLSIDDFAANHIDLIEGHDHGSRFLGLMGRAIANVDGDAAS